MLKWGFGIEKEFPILIGKFTKNELVKVFKSCISFYEKIFLDNNQDLDGYNLKDVLLNIKSTLVTNLQNTYRFLEDDQDFYINIDKLFNDEDVSQFDINLFNVYQSDFRFVTSKSNFIWFYTGLYQFLTEDFLYSDSVLGKYARIYLFTHLKNTFVDYYRSGILYKSNYCSNILSKLDGLYNSHQSPIKISYSNIFKIYTKTINSIEINYVTINGYNLEADSGGYEVRTDIYQNITIEECVEELDQNMEKLYLNLKYNLLTPRDRKNNKKIIFASNYASYYLPCLDEIETCFFTISLEQLYTGETEINITLPYQDTNIDNNIFKQNHIHLMKGLRILSPLFLAVLTGVQYFSFGDNNRLPETSLRFKELGYRLFTNLNLDDIYNIDDYNVYRHNKCILDILKKKQIIINDEEGIQEFSVNRNDIKYNPSKNKYFGFEWKVLDQYPTKFIPNISLFIILLAQWIINNNLDINDKLDCDKHREFLNNIIFQGWNTNITHPYFDEICNQFGFTDLRFNTLNKYKIIETCQSHKLSISRKKIIKLILFHKYSTLNKQKLNKLKTDKLLDILCSQYKNSLPNCYSFLQAIFHFLYNYFINTSENIDIIISFFPDFQTNKYLRYSVIPNINLINYNKMLDDYKQYHFKEYQQKKKEVIKNPSNDDYDDLYYYLYKD